MERYNPFERAADMEAESVVYGGESSPLERQPISASYQRSSAADPMAPSRMAPVSSSPLKSRYTTSFPDPFGDLDHSHHQPGFDDTASRQAGPEFGSTRSNSVTFSRTLEDADSTSQSRDSGRRQPGGLTTFLTRATSVTSSTVTDRMNEAVGSVRSAVDSLSSQIQQVVPGAASQTNSSNLGAQQQQQSTASYLASKFSSASQFGSPSVQSQSSSPLPVISRQRVLLVLEEPETLQWPQQFSSYRRFAAASAGQQSSLTSFISSATAQLTSTAATSLGLGAAGAKGESADLVEQADYRKVSVLSNQASSSVTVLVTAKDARAPLNVASKGAQKIVRPEFVVVRQNAMADSQLKALVLGLDHCMVPMLEPVEIWNVFQDRYQVFSRLLRVQKRLGKENFPLLPQIYCQTSLNLANYLQTSSAIPMPCLVRTISDPKSKIKVDSVGVLRSLATLIGTTNNTGCTLEPYLDVKCDLVVQKIGNSLKLFKRLVTQNTESGLQTGDTLSSSSTSSTTGFFTPSHTDTATTPTNRFEGGRQSLLRQSSLGGSMLSSLISSTTATSQPASVAKQQQAASGPGSFERMAEVTNRYKNWVEDVAREFDNKLEAFCLKIVITTSDREYVVGMNDCSMPFLGSPENQDEDKRNFVELIINSMDTALPNKTNLLRDHSAGSSGTPTTVLADSVNDTSRLLARDERSLPLSTPTRATPLGLANTQAQVSGQAYMMGDKKKFNSQTQINGLDQDTGRRSEQSPRSYGALSSRSQSVSMNQSDYCDDPDGGSSLKHHKGSLFMDRRGSNQLTIDDFALSGDRPDSQGGSLRMNQHQRQASLGQSFLDQTSTAFSSLQKQSWSFFKRLDSRAGDGTPPLSAKSEQTFGQLTNNFPQEPPDNSSRYYESSSREQSTEYKSQSIDSNLVETGAGSSGRSKPPKPPPPRSMQTMHDSSSFSSSRPTQTPNSTPVQTRQNSTARTGAESSHQKPYEPYDRELAQMLRSDPNNKHHHHHKPTSDQLESASPTGGSIEAITELRGRSVEGVRRNLEAMKRADSSSTTNSETTSTEDTMNNLKKTFASIFGDKCE